MKMSKETKCAALAAFAALTASIASADDLSLDATSLQVSEETAYDSVTLVNGASLAISAETTTVSTAFSVGAGANSGGNAITVSGATAGLAFDTPNTKLFFGSLGCDNSLVVSDGATLTQSGTSNSYVFQVGDGNARDLAQGCGNVIDISGQGTTAELCYLTLGTSGCNNRLSVRNGAEATFKYGVACSGVDRSGTNNQVVVENATVKFTRANGNNVYGFSAANKGAGMSVSGGGVEVSAGIQLTKGASMEATAGSTVKAGGNLSFGASQGGESSATFDASSFVSENAGGTAYIGNDSPSNTLSVVNGGSFKTAGKVVIGHNFSSIENANDNGIVVAGAGSVFTANTVQVGYKASHRNVFTVRDGATLEAGVYENGFGEVNICSFSNRLEVVDGATAAIGTFYKDSKCASNNVVLVRNGTLNMGTFNWKNGTVLRLEGTSSKVTWVTGARDSGSPTGGSVLEFVPPASVRKFDEAVVKMTASRPTFLFNLGADASNPFVVRIADAKPCISAGGGKYPLLAHQYALSGSLDDVVLDAPKGTQLLLENENRELWVKIPGSSGLVVTIR